VKKLHGDPTVGSPPKFWTRGQNRRSSGKGVGRKFSGGGATEKKDRKLAKNPGGNGKKTEK